MKNTTTKAIPTKALTIPVSNEEHEALKALAKKNRMTLAGYIRQVCLRDLLDSLEVNNGGEETKRNNTISSY